VLILQAIGLTLNFASKPFNLTNLILTTKDEIEGLAVRFCPAVGW